MSIVPFGSDNAQASPNIGVQKFLGLTVVDFSCNSSWDSQGGQCTVKLVQDDGEYLENVLVGSPQFFEIVNNDATPIFRFYGILKELSRSVSPGGKFYIAVLQSPTLLLEACHTVDKGFTGPGSALEAYGPNILANTNFGSNNDNYDATRVFNIQNVFGLFENPQYGGVPSDISGLTSLGFGGSAITDEGMRLDYFAYAIDQLVNGGIGAPYLGGNILYGTTSYTNGSAYAYNFDILGFIQQIVQYIPNDYRVTSNNLMDFVSEICETINHVFYIDLLKPPGEGNSAFADGHISTTIPIQSHANTVYGGQIVVITQNRNVIDERKFPLSQYIINKEISDKTGGSGQTEDLPLDIGITGSTHPDGPPVASAPYGGNFPVEEITLDEYERLKSSEISVTLNQGAVGAKFVVGGFQSRINYVCTILEDRDVSPAIPSQSAGVDYDPTPDVYQYWGDINISARSISAPNNPMLKNVPVLARVATWRSGDQSSFRMSSETDFIVVDCIDIVGRLTTPATNGVRLFEDGLYITSLSELAAAAESEARWNVWMAQNKSRKLAKFRQIATNQTFFNQPYRTYDGLQEGYTGKAVYSQAKHWSGLYNMSASNLEEDESDCLYPSNWYSVYTRLLCKRLRDIWDRHYCKTYAIKAPVYSIKLNPDYTPTKVQDYLTTSWNIVDDAFLDPSKWDEYVAPQGSFLNNGRIKAYATFQGASKSSVSQAINENTISPKTMLTILEAAAGGATPPYGRLPDFSKYDVDSLYARPFPFNCPHQRFATVIETIVSVPITLQPNYMVLPPNYFSVYDTTILQPLTFSQEESIRDIRPEMANVRSSLLNMVLSYADTNGTPFVIASLENKVGADARRSFKIKPICDPEEGREANAEYKINYLQNLHNSNEREGSSQHFLHPLGFGIPQQSNRFVYGPWVTNTTLKYGTKFEYEQHEDLVPENYLNFNLMNDIGQLKADSVENFDFLYVEEGGLTLTGLPKVTHLGQSLVENGPLVSDISINISAADITTNYSMKTFAPKFGKIGKYYADKITKIISKLKS